MKKLLALLLGFMLFAGLSTPVMANDFLGGLINISSGGKSLFGGDGKNNPVYRVKQANHHYNYYRKDGSNKKVHLATRDIYSDGTLGQVKGGRFNIPDGEVLVYFNSDKQEKIQWRITYKGNKRNGPAIEYYESGEEKTKMQYKDDLPEGEVTHFYINGDVSKREYYLGQFVEYSYSYLPNRKTVNRVEVYDKDQVVLSHTFKPEESITMLSKDDVIKIYDDHQEQKRKQQEAANRKQLEEDNRIRRTAYERKRKLLQAYSNNGDWQEIKATVGRNTVPGTNHLDQDSRFNQQFKDVRVFRNLDEGQIALILELEPLSKAYGRFIIRLGDKNGNYLTHFYTKSFMRDGLIRVNTSRTILAGEEVKELVYAVNLRDLRDTGIVEIGFDSEYSPY